MSRWADARRARAGLRLAIALIGTAPWAAGAQEARVAGQGPDAEDVAMTPLHDLNLAKDPIHPVLVEASGDPYAIGDATDCTAIGAAIAALDTALGPDVDVAAPTNDRINPGRVAKSLVASLIPFRGVLRELSGASEHERNHVAAIYAGLVRRGFLKGIGQQQGCPYPARPAFVRVAVGRVDKAAVQTAQLDIRAALPTAPTMTFVSEPVVQPAPATARRARRR